MLKAYRETMHRLVFVKNSFEHRDRRVFSRPNTRRASVSLRASFQGAIPKWCTEYMIFFSFCDGFLLNLFLRDDCSPI